MEINNTIALVTSGAHGIGRALCRALHGAGAPPVTSAIVLLISMWVSLIE